MPMAEKNIASKKLEINSIILNNAYENLSTFRL
jgi:hypothetical protein